MTLAACREALEATLEDWQAQVAARSHALDPALSPCRPHPCSRDHAALVEGFRDAQHAQWLREQEHAQGYPEETAAFYGEAGAAPGLHQEVRLTWRRWLDMAAR